MRRIFEFFEDFARIWGKAGFRASFRFVRSRIFARSETLLYELRTAGIEQDLPVDWCVRVVSSMEDSAGVDLLRRAGGGSELRNFRRKARVLFICIGDEPVARGWYFPDNYLARRLGPDAAYIGTMFVEPKWRGQGIQARLATYMTSLLPAGSRAVLEVLPSNVASQKGLAKAGCVFVGRLQTIVFLGQIIRARIDVSPHADNPS